MEHRFPESECDRKIHICLGETSQLYPNGITEEEYLSRMNTIIYLVMSWIEYHEKPFRGDSSGDYWQGMICELVNDYLDEYSLPQLDETYILSKAFEYKPV